MAEQQEQGGNIRMEYNNATTGLNMDQTVNQIPKGKLTYALNAVVENFDANSVNYQNEPGNEPCFDFPSGYVLIGTHFIQEKNKHIFFITNPNTGDSQIGFMENNDCTYRVLVNALCLNFNVNYPIHKIVHKITNCSTEVYWTDGYNPRRYLDIDNIPKILKSGTPLCDPQYTDDVDCNQLNLQPNFKIPQLEVTDVTNLGNLIAGTYQFAIQYADSQGNPYTSYYSVTNPTPIADEFVTNVNFNYPVGKSIILSVSNLEDTGLYDYFNVAVIKTINGITSVELVGTYYIDSLQKEITYTGQNVSQIRLAIDDIFEKFPYYDIAQDVTTAQDVLIWSNLTSIDRINYQSIASQITLQWETYRIPATENYADELNATNLRGYLRDEVYAFEIVFLLRNGRQTDGFHIPGRAKSALENLLPDVPDTNPDFIGEPEYVSGGVGYSPYWKIYNTGSVIGSSPGYSTDPKYKGPYQYGEFAYWESVETYPCNEDVWGDLAGKPIRHHKFPDVNIIPAYETKLFTTASGMVMGNDAVFPIGVKLDVRQIQSLIATSDLTQEQKDEIVGFKIVRGDRGTNKSIVAKGILRNVNTYEREQVTYFYPNYPYNDLRQDPFLNLRNNAFSQICEGYTINITKLQTDFSGGPSYAEIQYISCDTNKSVKIKYYELGSKNLCSISRPLILGDAEGTVSLSTYEIWKVQVCAGVFPAGFVITWNDAFEGPKETWLTGWPARPVLTLYVVPNSGGVQKKNPNQGGSLCIVSGPELVVGENCKTETPQHPFTEKYRQIFNSPETSFGQPFLGNILKLESVMFGKGRAHFVEVKNNAKYKLITKEAQQDALASAEDIANIVSPFSATAMFTAYQAYLTIYINGITRKNYAYSFNSVADYNYGVGVPDNLGIKQRTLDIARYLIPGVQNVGDTNDINNYNRESSVFLRTDLSKDPLPFPDQSPNMLSGTIPIVTDKSRLTISEVGNCGAPAKENDISVVSYYASLKNVFVNQYGQIYSYDTVDTGFQSMFDGPQSQTVFGGDTFISRFTFKTKLPFFIDNRVNAPDDSDIFYDEIGNIAYPKYWHSARSILSDYTVQGTTVLSNIISYKAHSFDCPNDQLPPPPDSGPGRTFYDGYFYLFAYGIPNFYCESSYNLDLRQAFNNREGDFWPHVSSGIPDDWVQETFVPIAQDNTYYYNTSFSKQNRENTFTHLPVDWGKPCYTFYPFRAIYSESQNIDSDNRVNSWLIYRPVSYFDFPQNFGDLTSLDGIQNRAVLARFENKTLMYNNLLTIDTSNPQAAYVGNPMLFRGAPPIDFAETDLGYVGSQHKMLLKIPFGQVTIDAKRGQVFLINGTQAIDLSGFGSGLNRFFTEHMAFEILRFFPNVNVDNHFAGIGLHGVFDTKYERILITKLDYTPKIDGIIYDEELKQFFYNDKISKTVTVKVPISVTDEEYFCNRSFTVSYNFNTKSWISFHGYFPNWYIGENNFFYSGVNGCCEDFEALVGIQGPVPSTTTSTSTTRITTTTTSTTTTINCNLGGIIIQTSCNLPGGSAVIIGELPGPVRPPGLIDEDFGDGYVDEGSGITVYSTGSYSSSCNAIGTLNSAIVDGEYVGYYPSYTMVQTAGIEVVGNPVFVNDGTQNYNLVPDGWYFTEESMSNNEVFHIVNGIIVEIISCNATTSTTSTTSTSTTSTTSTTTTSLVPTTTTTTTTACIQYEAQKINTASPSSSVSWIDCFGEFQSAVLNNYPATPYNVVFCAVAGSVSYDGSQIDLFPMGSCSLTTTTSTTSTTSTTTTLFPPSTTTTSSSTTSTTTTSVPTTTSTSTTALTTTSTTTTGVPTTTTTSTTTLYTGQICVTLIDGPTLTPYTLDYSGIVNGKPSYTSGLNIAFYNGIRWVIYLDNYNYTFESGLTTVNDPTLVPSWTGSQGAVIVTSGACTTTTTSTTGVPTTTSSTTTIFPPSTTSTTTTSAGTTTSTTTLFPPSTTTTLFPPSSTTSTTTLFPPSSTTTSTTLFPPSSTTTTTTVLVPTTTSTSTTILTTTTTSTTLIPCNCYQITSIGSNYYWVGLQTCSGPVTAFLPADTTVTYCLQGTTAPTPPAPYIIVTKCSDSQCSGTNCDCDTTSTTSTSSTTTTSTTILPTTTTSTTTILPTTTTSSTTSTTTTTIIPTTSTTTTQLPLELCLDAEINFLLEPPQQWDLLQSFVYEFTQSNGYYSYGEFPFVNNRLRLSYLSGSVFGTPAPQGDGWYLWSYNDDMGFIYLAYSPSTTQNILNSTSWVGSTGGFFVPDTQVVSFVLTEGLCTTTSTTTTIIPTTTTSTTTSTTSTTTTAIPTTTTTTTILCRTYTATSIAPPFARCNSISWTNCFGSIQSVVLCSSPGAGEISTITFCAIPGTLTYNGARISVTDDGNCVPSTTTSTTSTTTTVAPVCKSFTATKESRKAVCNTIYWTDCFGNPQFQELCNYNSMPPNEIMTITFCAIDGTLNYNSLEISVIDNGPCTPTTSTTSSTTTSSTTSTTTTIPPITTSTTTSSTSTTTTTVIPTTTTTTSTSSTTTTTTTVVPTTTTSTTSTSTSTSTTSTTTTIAPTTTTSTTTTIPTTTTTTTTIAPTTTTTSSSSTTTTTTTVVPTTTTTTTIVGPTTTTSTTSSTTSTTTTIVPTTTTTSSTTTSTTTTIIPTTTTSTTITTTSTSTTTTTTTAVPTTTTTSTSTTSTTTTLIPTTTSTTTTTTTQYYYTGRYCDGSDVFQVFKAPVGSLVGSVVYYNGVCWNLISTQATAPAISITETYNNCAYCNSQNTTTTTTSTSSTTTSTTSTTSTTTTAVPTTTSTTTTELIEYIYTAQWCTDITQNNLFSSYDGSIVGHSFFYEGRCWDITDTAIGTPIAQVPAITYPDGCLECQSQNTTTSTTTVQPTTTTTTTTINCNLAGTAVQVADCQLPGGTAVETEINLFL